MYQVGTGVSAVPTIATKYLSTAPYIDASIPRAYDDCILNVPTFTRSVERTTLRGQYRAQVGELQIASHDGRHDDLLPLALDGSDVDVYIGDPTWQFADFIHLFNATALLVAAPSLSTLRITLRDAGLLLNKSIGGMVQVGGVGPNANQYRPFNFGFVHQADAILYDQTVGGGQYVHSDTGTNTAAVEVRNDGVPVTFTDNADGTFTLAVPAAGNEKITCDVLADIDGSGLHYRGTDVLLHLIGDRAGLSALGRYSGPGAMYEVLGVNDYHIGLNIKEKKNVIEVLDDVMNSLNAFWGIDRLGNFFFDWMRPSALQFFIDREVEGVELQAEIVKDDCKAGTLVVSHNAPTYYNVQAIGNVNWTSQATFASSLTENERAMYTRPGYYTSRYYGEDPGSTQYLGTTPYNGGAPQLYHLSMTDGPRVSTLIAGPDDTSQFLLADPIALFPEITVDEYLQDWAAVRRSQLLPWMEFIDVTVGLEFYWLELGDVVRLTFDRYDLDSGELYQICTVGINASARQVVLGMVRRHYAGILGEALSPGYPLGLEPARITITGLVPTVVINDLTIWFLDNFNSVDVPGEVGSAGVTGLAPTIIVTANVVQTPGIGSVIANGLAPSTIANVLRTPGIGSIVASGLTPTRLRTPDPLVVELLFNDGAGSGTAANTGSIGGTFSIGGSLTPSIVASGGWDGGGYLQFQNAGTSDNHGGAHDGHPSELIIGTADFEISVYARFVTWDTQWGQCFWGWEYGTRSPRLYCLDVTGELYFVDDTISVGTGFICPKDSTWRQYKLRRVSGVIYVLVDDDVKYSAAYTANCNSGFNNGSFRVGTDGNTAAGQCGSFDDFKFYNYNV